MERFRNYIIRSSEYAGEIDNYTEEKSYGSLNELENEFKGAYEEEYAEYIDLLIDCNCIDIIKNELTGNYDVYFKEHPMV